MHPLYNHTFICFTHSKVPCNGGWFNTDSLIDSLACQRKMFAASGSELMLRKSQIAKRSLILHNIAKRFSRIAKLI